MQLCVCVHVHTFLSVCVGGVPCASAPDRHLTMRNERISEERPLYSPGSMLGINNALLGNRGNAETSPALRTSLLFLLQRCFGVS